jgi:hypothetical protein
MQKGLPISTRAMRRAAKAEARKAGKLSLAEHKILDAVHAAAVEGVVLDADLVEIPPEPGKVAFSVELEDASLNWNASWNEVDQAMVHTEAGLDAAGIVGEKRRSTARELVIRTMLANRHMRGETGGKAAAMVMWLIFTSEIGPSLRERGIGSAGYVITPKGPGDWNFRLIAGGSP